MTSTNYLIIGQGDVGVQVTNRLAAQDYKVTGLARGVRDNYKLNTNANYMQLDALQLTAQQLVDFTHIAIIVSPDNYDSEGYQETYLAIAQHIAKLEQSLLQLQCVVFISSTGVYGQSHGEWIDETVAPQPPKRESSAIILQAEQVLQTVYAERLIIVRPSGIYGTKRLMRIRKAQQQHKAPMPRFAWTNRIMDSDLVNILFQILSHADPVELKSIYLATDYAPVTSFELTSWLADRLDSSQPEIADEEVSGKRLLSNIPRSWLTYPDWQLGYSHILQTLP